MFWFLKKRREEENEHDCILGEFWMKATDIGRGYAAFRSTEEEEHTDHAYNLLGMQRRAAIRRSKFALEETSEARHRNLECWIWKGRRNIMS
jgi:hypothetical protein